jgi:hypothetical protein
VTPARWGFREGVGVALNHAEVPPEEDRVHRRVAVRLDCNLSTMKITIVICPPRKLLIVICPPSKLRQVLQPEIKTRLTNTLARIYDDPANTTKLDHAEVPPEEDRVHACVPVLLGCNLSTTSAQLRRPERRASPRRRVHGCLRGP